MKFFVKSMVVLSAFAASSAFAQTIAEKKQMAKWNETIAEDKKHFVEKCGYDIPVTLDPKFVAPFLARNANAGSYCSEALSAMAKICGDADSKATIAKNVKKLDCKLGTQPETDRDPKFTVKGGTLTFEFTWHSANLSDNAVKFLENNL